MLDGVDITNVPTDFSTHENGDLEVVFSQYPARFVGTVTNGQGQPVKAVWVLICAADRALRRPWATTSHAFQTDARGAFQVTSLPGGYLVRALPSSSFSSNGSALQEIQRCADGGVPVELGDRESKRLTLTVTPRGSALH